MNKSDTKIELIVEDLLHKAEKWHDFDSKINWADDVADRDGNIIEPLIDEMMVGSEIREMMVLLDEKMDREVLDRIYSLMNEAQEKMIGKSRLERSADEQLVKNCELLLNIRDNIDEYESTCLN